MSDATEEAIVGLPRDRTPNENSHSVSDLGMDVSRSEYPPRDVSDVTAPPEHGSASKPAWQDEVRRLTIRELRERFPREHSSHRSMLGREKAGRASVDERLRNLRDFILAIGVCPGPQWTVDRITYSDPEYAPEKIRWADKREQSNNRHTTRRLRDSHGVVRPLSDVARLTGQKADTLRTRLRRGWDHEEVVSGKRKRLGTQSGSTAAVPLSGWPAGANSKDWEPPYQQWHRRWGQRPSYTREVFFSWICWNCICYFRSLLERKYGLWDDDKDIDSEVIGDDIYIRLIKCLSMYALSKTIVDSDTFQRKTWMHLTQGRPNVFTPSEALKAARISTEGD